MVMTDANAPVLAPAPAPRRGFAMGLMVLSSVLISFGGLIMRNMEAADAWQINLYRSLAFMVAVTLILLLRYRRDTIVRVRAIGRLGLLGGGLLAVAGIAFIQALTHTTVANTLFTLSAIPFITAGLARVLLKERLRRATLVTMLVAALGIFVMVAEGFGLGSGSGYGNAMALLTALGFSGFAIIVRHNRRIDMLPTLLVSGTIIALVSLAARFDDLGVSLNDLLLCFLWGGVLSGLANGMFIVASRHLVAAEVTLFMLLEFALGPVWVWLFVDEVPTLWTLVGGVLVIASVTLRAILELRDRGQPLKRGRPSPG
jgi:drug/metabolite transporter (DMT)-like permease